MAKFFVSLFIVASSALSAQISFAAKAHMLFPTASASWKNLRDTASRVYEDKGKNSMGFNVGVSSKINLPMSFFVMPELYFTSFKNEVNYGVESTTLQAKSNRLDLPVLVGYNVWGETIGIFAGPVASYNLSTKNTYRDFQENAAKDFTVGIQLGVQAKISKLIVDARYEGAFTKDQREFVNKNLSTSYNVTYDNRPSLFMVGLGYKF